MSSDNTLRLGWTADLDMISISALLLVDILFAGQRLGSENVVVFYPLFIWKNSPQISGSVLTVENWIGSCG